jgi:AAA domain
MPLPTAWVDSGGGLHVYWISGTPIPEPEWRAYADGLKALLLQRGVLCDAGLTTDSARLLRVPGTLNHKYNPARPVKLLGKSGLGKLYDFSTDLSFLKNFSTAQARQQTAAAAPAPVAEPIEPGAVFDTPDPAFATLDPTDGAVSAGISSGPKLVDPFPIFAKCAFLGEALKNGGKDYDNPKWNLSVLCTAFMENGNELAHEVSKSHPTYNYDDTQAMYERKLADRDRGVGYPRCTTIHSAGCKSCVTCPFLAAGKSPLNIRPVVTATVNPSATAAGLAAWSPAAMRVSFSSVRHRRTLYGFDLVRGEITVLGSPGGFGKSSLAIGMGISVSVGKELLCEKIRGGGLKVLLINGEDSSEEIHRRVWAFCLAFGLTEQELDRLYVAGADDPCVQSLSFLKTNERGQSQLDATGLSQLRAVLQLLSPDVVVLDPFVAFCASGNMNDNPSMSLVMRALKWLATEFDCAILIVAHTNKTGEPGTAGAVSGAASIVNLARRAIMPIWVSEEEAKAWGILPSERARYIKLMDAKSNLVPRSNDVPVYRLHSIELPNAEPPIYPLGDNVHAVVRVQVPIPNGITGSTDEEKIRKTILDLVDQGKAINGIAYPYSPSAAGADNARALLPDAIAAARNITAPRQWSPGDLEAVVKNAFKTMMAEGTVVSRPMKELVPKTDRFQRGRGLQVDHSHLSKGGSNATDTGPAA